jgi:hypothetical protein
MLSLGPFGVAEGGDVVLKRCAAKVWRGEWGELRGGFSRSSYWCGCQL